MLSWNVLLTLVLQSLITQFQGPIKKQTFSDLGFVQRYTYRVLQTNQMKLILLCGWAEQAILCSAKNALNSNMKSE